MMRFHALFFSILPLFNFARCRTSSASWNGTSSSSSWNGNDSSSTWNGTDSASSWCLPSNHTNPFWNSSNSSLPWNYTNPFSSWHCTDNSCWEWNTSTGDPNIAIFDKLVEDFPQKQCPNNSHPCGHIIPDLDRPIMEPLCSKGKPEPGFSRFAPDMTNISCYNLTGHTAREAKVIFKYENCLCMIYEESGCAPNTNVFGRGYAQLWERQAKSYKCWSNEDALRLSLPDGTSSVDWDKLYGENATGENCRGQGNYAGHIQTDYHNPVENLCAASPWGQLSADNQMIKNTTLGANCYNLRSPPHAASHVNLFIEDGFRCLYFKRPDCKAGVTWSWKGPFTVDMSTDDPVQSVSCFETGKVEAWTNWSDIAHTYAMYGRAEGYNDTDREIAIRKAQLEDPTPRYYIWP